jgi:hypothetical protein
VHEAGHLFSATLAALSMKQLGGHEIEIAAHYATSLPRKEHVFGAVFEANMDDLNGIDVLEGQAVGREDFSVIENGEVERGVCRGSILWSLILCGNVCALNAIV